MCCSCKKLLPVMRIAPRGILLKKLVEEVRLSAEVVCLVVKGDNVYVTEMDERIGMGYDERTPHKPPLEIEVS